jgi:hypothetical protein
LEFFERPDGELVFLEVGARPPGGKSGICYEKNTGFSYDIAHFQAQLRLPIDLQEHQSDEFYSWAFLPLKAGKVVRLNTPTLQSHFHIDWFIKKGDITKSSPNLISASNMGGIIYFNHRDYSILVEDFDKLRNFDATEIIKNVND